MFESARAQGFKIDQQIKQKIYDANSVYEADL